jgi:hypothetical protein
MPEPRFELPETFDRAASAHARMDGVAMGAQAIVVRLQVEAAIEIEGRAVFVELGANPGAVGEHEVHLLVTRKHCSAYDRGRNALRSLVFDPFDLRNERTRLDRNAKDDLVLDDQASDGFLDDARLHGDKPQQHWNQAQEDCRSHLPARPHSGGFAAKR